MDFHHRMTPHVHYIFGVVWRGLSGISGALFAVILPWQDQLDWGIRIAGGLIGLLVGILSAIALFRGMKLHSKSVDID